MESLLAASWMWEASFRAEVWFRKVYPGQREIESKRWKAR